MVFTWIYLLLNEKNDLVFSCLVPHRFIIEPLSSRSYGRPGIVTNPLVFILSKMKG